MKHRWLVVVIGSLMAALWWPVSGPNAAVNAQSGNSQITVALPTRFGTVERVDPSATTNVAEADWVINSFLQLVRANPNDPTQVQPSLAASWDISADGSVYTFYLHRDVYWVSYDPDTNTIIRERAVTAGDVVNGIFRVCDDINNGFFATDVIAPAIEGCITALDGRDPADVVQVRAVNDLTVEFTLSEPGGHFLRMIALTNASPFPPESVGGDGEAWTGGAPLWTNGPFVPTSEGLLRNPYLPQPIAGPGNIDVVTFGGTYNGPTTDYNFPISGMNWINFSVDRAPTDNVHLRRALATAFVRPPTSSTQLPMFHFAPQVLFGGISDTAIGIGYDLDYAREQMELAGYPNCEGMPTLYFNTSTRFVGPAISLDDIIAMYQPLGCTAQQFAIGGIPQDLGEPSTRLLLPEDRPHFFAHATWYPDYGDVDNYMNILECGTNNTQNRRCSELDTLIARARRSTDEAERIQLYLDINEGFFGRDGEFPLIPISREVFTRSIPVWLTGPFSTNGIVNGERYDFYTVDVTAAPNSVFNGATTPPNTADAEPIGSPTPATTSAQSTPTASTPPASTPASTAAGRLPPFDQDAPNCQLLTFYIVNVRAAPSPDAVVNRRIDYGQIIDGIAQATGPNGITYWQIGSDDWVRSDVVFETLACNDLPLVQP